MTEVQVPNEAVVLYTSTPSTIHIESAQRQSQDILEARRVDFVLIDGSQQSNKAMRSMLWEVSQLRAVYPQVFSRSSQADPADPKSYTFLGDLPRLAEEGGLEAALSQLRRRTS